MSEDVSVRKKPDLAMILPSLLGMLSRRRPTLKLVSSRGRTPKLVVLLDPTRTCDSLSDSGASRVTRFYEACCRWILH